MNKQEKLKQLVSEERRLKASVKYHKDHAAEVQREAQSAADQLQKVKAEIKALKDPQIIEVTDHAVVRYAQRVMDLDIDAIRAKILTDDVKNQINAMGSGKYPIGNGFKAVCCGEKIVSVIG